MELIASESEERNFVDFRRKVRSAAMERLCRRFILRAGSASCCRMGAR